VSHEAALVAAREASPREAMSFGGALAQRVRAAGRPCFGARSVRGPAVALGRWQREARVIDAARCAQRAIPVLRRESSGTAVFLPESGAALLAMALPSLSALAPDAKGPTVLNRNVRGWLQGLTKHGALAHYFGREWVSIAKRPAAVIGLSVAQDGLTVIELWIGLREPVALPDELVTERERGTDRWLARRPLAWNEAAPTRPLSLDALDAINTRAIERYGLSAVPVAREAMEHHTGALPCNEPARWLEPVPCAIGWIDLGIEPDGARWVGGDLLVGDAARERIARALETESEPQRRGALAACVDEDVCLGASVDDLMAGGARCDEGVRSLTS
jgi:hypothetical protein